MPEDLTPGFDSIWEILRAGLDDLPTMPTDSPNPLSDLLSEFFGGLGDIPGGFDPGLPTNGDALYYILEAFFGGFHGLPGSTPPDSGPGGSIEDFLGAIFNGVGDSPGDSPGGSPSTPGVGGWLAEVIADLDSQPPGVSETTPLMDEAKAEPEWDGNVPPDLTDGFDFLL